MSAPSFRQLLDYAEGRLPRPERARIDAILAEAGPETRAELAWIEAFLQQARATPLHPLPAELEARLREEFAIRRAARPASDALRSLGRSFTQFFAELIADSQFAPAQAGLRAGEGGEATRQITFGSEHFDIVVNSLLRADRRFDLHGQVFARAADELPAAASAQLLADDREHAIASVDSYGEFQLPAITVGRYTLVIAGTEWEIHSAPFELGS